MPHDKKPNLKRIGRILKASRELAVQYYEATGKPLGITGEIAEYEAARILDLELAPARQPGYDAIRRGRAKLKRIQIKGRRLSGSGAAGQLGRIRLDQDWDSVVLVLLDSGFRPTEIFEADRASVSKAIKAPGSKSRNIRGALSITQFIAIGQRLWPRQTKV